MATAKNNTKATKSIKEKNDDLRLKAHDAFVDFLNAEIDNPDNVFESKIDKETFEMFQPKNGFTDKTYSAINHALLFCVALKRKDPRFATFSQIKENEKRLIKGSHGNLAVMHFPMIRDENTGDLRPANNSDDFEDIAFWKARGFLLFNFQDIENMGEYKPVKNIKVMPKIENIERMFLNYSEATNCRLLFSEITYKDCLGYYNTTKHEIHLMPKEAFRSKDDYYGVLLHELAHSTGAALGRNMLNRQRTKGYNREELVAEISSFMLCQKYGVTFNHAAVGNSLLYLKGYASSDLVKRREELDYAVTEAEKVIKYLASFEDKENTVDNSEDVSGVNDVINGVIKTVNDIRKPVEPEKNVLTDGSTGWLFDDFDKTEPAKKKTTTKVVKTSKAKKDVAAASVLKRLSKKATVKKSTPSSKNDVAALIAGLTPEQLKTLKAMLTAC